MLVIFQVAAATETAAGPRRHGEHPGASDHRIVPKFRLEFDRDSGGSESDSELDVAPLADRPVPPAQSPHWQDPDHHVIT